MLEAVYRSRRREEIPLDGDWDIYDEASRIMQDGRNALDFEGSGAIPLAGPLHPFEAAYQADQRDAAEYTEDYGTTESLRPRRASYGDRSEGDEIIIDDSISYVVPRSNTSPLPRARALQSSDRDRNPGGMGVRKEVVPGSKPVAAPQTFRGVSMEAERERERLRVYQRARARTLERDISEERERDMERALERELRDLERSEREQDRERDLDQRALRAVVRGRFLPFERRASPGSPLFRPPQAPFSQPLVHQEVVTHHRHITPNRGRALYSQQRRRSPESSKSMQTTNNGYESDYEKPESAGTGRARNYNGIILRRPPAKATADDLSSGEDGGGRRPGPRQIQFRKMNHKFGKMMFADSVSGDSSTVVLSSANETISKDNTKGCARQLKLLAELGPKRRSYWVNGQSPQEQETSTTPSVLSKHLPGRRAETLDPTSTPYNIRYATPPTQYRQYSDDESPRRSSARPKAETLSRRPLAADPYIVPPPSPPEEEIKSRANGGTHLVDEEDLDDMEKEILGLGSEAEEEGEEDLDDVDKALLGLAGDGDETEEEVNDGGMDADQAYFYH